MCAKRQSKVNKNWKKLVDFFFFYPKNAVLHTYGTVENSNQTSYKRTRTYYDLFMVPL